MYNKDTYFIILAGGNGTRLWPLSRQSKPKQFLEVGDNKTLIDQAINRISTIAPKENIWVSTNADHKENIIKQVGNKIGNIIIEPALRDTAAAIALACLKIKNINPQASIVFLPADPFIPQKEIFINYIKQAIKFIKNNNKITLIGIKPTHPATGYGYIKFDKKSEQAPYPVLQFCEKPDLKLAKEYIKQENMAWNIGTFCAKCSTFIQEFATHCPEILDGVKKYLNGAQEYNTVKKESIDYAIMEKSKNICVIPADFQWCDVGNLEVFLDIEQKYKKLDSNIICVNASNNLVKTKKKLVALIDVEDLCIVETDDILLVTKRDKSEKVKQIVQKLKAENNKEYL